MDVRFGVGVSESSKAVIFDLELSLKTEKSPNWWRANMKAYGEFGNSTATGN